MLPADSESVQSSHLVTPDRGNMSILTPMSTLFLFHDKGIMKLLHKFPPKNPLQHSVLIGLHQSVCLCVCVWHIQHSNCVSLVGQRGIGVLNPILNLYLSYRGGGVAARAPTICHGPQFRGIEYGWETSRGPGVATGSRFRECVRVFAHLFSDRKWNCRHQHCKTEKDLL